MRKLTALVDMLTGPAGPQGPQGPAGPAGADGTDGTALAVTAWTPITGAAVQTTALVDELTYVTPAGALANLAWGLPKRSECRVGQRKWFFSSQAIASFSVFSEFDDDVTQMTIGGAGLTSAAANTTYQFVCVSVTAPGRWVRLS